MFLIIPAVPKGFVSFKKEILYFFFLIMKKKFLLNYFYNLNLRKKFLKPKFLKLIKTCSIMEMPNWN